MPDHARSRARRPTPFAWLTALLVAACWILTLPVAHAQSMPGARRCDLRNAPDSAICRHLEQRIATLAQASLKVSDRMREATDAREVAEMTKQLRQMIGAMQGIRNQFAPETPAVDGDATPIPGDPRHRTTPTDRLLGSLDAMISQLNRITDTRKQQQDCLLHGCLHTQGGRTQPQGHPSEHHDNDAGDTQSHEPSKEQEQPEAPEVEHECPACEAAREAAIESKGDNSGDHPNGDGEEGMPTTPGVDAGHGHSTLYVVGGRVIHAKHGNRPTQVVDPCKGCGINVANKGVNVTGRPAAMPCVDNGGAGPADAPHPCKHDPDPDADTATRMREQVLSDPHRCQDCIGRGVKNGVLGPIKSPKTSAHIGDTTPPLPPINPAAMRQLAVTHDLRLSSGKTLMARGTGSQRALGVADRNGHVTWYPRARLMRTTGGHLLLQLADHRQLPLQ